MSTRPGRHPQPRPYRMERRRELSDENRARIVTAARDLLAARDRSVKFTIEEIARRAGVARMTVYYQFGSMRGLLEGLCNSLAVAGGMDQLADAFRNRDPLAGLDHFVAVFMRFWETDRDVLRGLRALALLDPDIAAVLEERAGWRRKGLRVLLDRIAKQTRHPRPKEMDDAVDLLFMLTEFHTYDTLAGRDRTLSQVTTMVRQLARKAIL